MCAELIHKKGLKYNKGEVKENTILFKDVDKSLNSPQRKSQDKS